MTRKRLGARGSDASSLASTPAEVARATMCARDEDMSPDLRAALNQLCEFVAGLTEAEFAAVMAHYERAL